MPDGISGLQLGSRVCAIGLIENEVVWVVGEGRYIGDEVPEAGIGAGTHLDELRQAGARFPTVLLDSGARVYDFEAWLVPAGELEATVGTLARKELPLRVLRELMASQAGLR